MFLFLGLSLGPLAQGFAIAMLSPKRSPVLANITIGIGMKAYYRPAITFNVRNELTLKKRQYSEKHDSEYISFGGGLMGSATKRYLDNPQNRIHAFYGAPLAFVEEHFGVVVDPRDVAIARWLYESHEHGDYEHRVRKGETLREAVKGVFSNPKGYVGVELPEVMYLFSGSADSQVVDRIRSFYEKSQSPKNTTTALKQMLIPLAAFVIIFLLGAFTAGKTGGSAGGGGAPVPSGNTSTIGPSALLLLWAIPKPSVAFDRHDIRDLLVVLLYAGVYLGMTALLLLAMPAPYPLFGIALPVGGWAVVLFTLGVVIVPIITTWFGRSLGGIGRGLGDLYLILGLLGYRKPVFTYDEGRYHIVPYHDHEWEVEPRWYRFAFTKVGVGFVNKPENWPDGTVFTTSQVRELVGADATADGGQVSDLPAPPGFTGVPEIKLGNIYGYLPSKPDPRDVHVRTDRTTGWFHGVGQDSRLLWKAFQTAKDDFGGGKQPLGDITIMVASGVMVMLALLLNFLLFW